MKSPLVLRKASVEDVPQILSYITDLAIFEEAEHEVEATVESLTRTLGFSGEKAYAHVIMADYESAPAGMALYFSNYSTWKAAPGIYLEDLYVKPEFRSKGIGRALISYLARETRRIGGARLEWSVLDWNEKAIRVYEGVGAKKQDGWSVMRVAGEALTKLGDSAIDAVEKY
ncbi:Peroxygenase 1 [Saitoella coloradoensis]